MNELRHIDVYPRTPMAVRITWSTPNGKLKLGDFEDGVARRARSSEGVRHTEGRRSAPRNNTG
jgi:hypothetical protein